MSLTYKSRMCRGAAIVLLGVVLFVSLGLPALATDPVEGLAGKLKQMSPDDQIVLLNGMLKDGIEDARLHFFLGNALFSSQQLKQAITEYETALSLKSDYPKAYVNMGITYDTMRNRLAARKAYNQAIELNPDDVLAYCHLGFNYQSAGQPDQAMTYYKKALSIDPNSAQAHYNLGLAFAEAKIFNEALVEWNKVIKLDPEGQLGKTAAENVELIKTYMELGS